MSRRLEDHLYPAGTAADPNITPSVLDSDGVAITYTSAKRKTNESTVVDVGDASNSNTGDPLRNAFIKVNNFMEASYWANESIVKDIDVVVARIDSDSAVVSSLVTRMDSADSDLLAVADATAPTIVTADTLAESGNYYVVKTAGTIITLPPTPNIDDFVTVKDGTGAAETSPFTVARNGSKIAGADSDLNFDMNYQEITMVYIDNTLGWSV